VQSRLRFLGGATNHWQGWCRPLDAIDFEERPWLDHSRWPIQRADLEPFYVRAGTLVGVRPFEDAGERAALSSPPLLADSRWFETTFFHINPLNFGAAFAGEIRSSPRVRLLLQANAVEIASDAGARHVESIAVASLGGHRLRVRARLFVLAGGGVENARLLLLSDGVAPAGLGNDRDLVGRFFMDHPHAHALTVAFSDPATEIALYRQRRVREQRQGVAAALRLSDAAQREHGLLNLLLTSPDRVDDLPAEARAGMRVAVAVDRMDPSRAAPDAEPELFTFESRSEQAPNPASRVTLGTERDALGARRARLEWTWLGQEGTTLHAVGRLLGRELGARGLGRAYLAPREGPNPRDFRGGYHHLGTTRMHRDPARGVVDADCRVHGVDNLFIAGSSVFPTSGCSNPTLTLLALALRMADRLRLELGR